MFKKIFLSIILAAVVIFLGMQFDRPQKNNSNNQTKHISTVLPVPDSVEAVLSIACYDCHSNNTRYPWYAEIQPVGWWLNGHILEGKKELNFSEFASYSMRRQYRKLAEISEMVFDDQMPLQEYLIMHRDAKLTSGQKALLMAWIRSVRDTLIVNFPDSVKAGKRQL